jgi:1-acyl-sn-glycerol-3-phosphate acyltransferase
VPIVPLVVEGSGGALPRNTWLFGGTLDIQLRVLEAVNAAEWEMGQVGELRDAVRQRMMVELERLRGGGAV